MMWPTTIFEFAPNWQTITRLGQSEIVLPAAMLAIAILFIKVQTRDLALRWLVGLVVAVLLTLATKLAFIGWGIGCAAIDFTGISGHAMCAAATYPLLLVALAADRSPRWAVALQCTGWSLSIAVALSRVMVGAHSPSEVVAGFLLGGAVSTAALAKTDTVTLRCRPVAIAVLLAWFSTGLGEMPSSQTHSRITSLALAISGNHQPFTRTNTHLYKVAPSPR
jgi:membrane-associated phospholipid phosphatase